MTPGPESAVTNVRMTSDTTRLALLEPLEQLLADGYGDRTWHGGILCGRGRVNPDRVIQCRRAFAGKTCRRYPRPTPGRHSRLNLTSPDRSLALPSLALPPGDAQPK